MPPKIEEDDHDRAPLSFNGSLTKYVHSPSSTPSTSPVKSLKRKVEVGDEELEIKPRPREFSRTTRSRTVQTTLSMPRASRSSQNARTVSATSATNNDDSPAAGSASPAPAKGPVSNLRDSIPHNLVLLLIGVNPGIMTGQTGYAYAHPTNLYWRLLHSSGITSFRHPPSDTYRMPELYCFGNTNIVSRATRDASELSKAEMNAGVPVLEEKIAKYRPEAVCLVGKGIWEAVWRVKKGRNIKKAEFKYGWQDPELNMGRVLPVLSRNGGDSNEAWEGARVFVATTTSALAATMSLATKEAIWKELGDWVKERREARGFILPTQDQALRKN
ncbi:hypothetical protein FQN57_006648 [Myotisia sp. PD_48]|nr:hypothetical protein FQN57_006648 [Myotisia sp. PD_48]